jgi:hypothetical protein
MPKEAVREIRAKPVEHLCSLGLFDRRQGSQLKSGVGESITISIPAARTTEIVTRIPL